MAAAFDLRPNDLLKHEIIRWARDSGRSHFVLGGGVTPDDGILRYKRGFAPTGIVPFTVGEWIHDLVAFESLVRHRKAYEEARDDDQAGWVPVNGFFPAYRC